MIKGNLLTLLISLLLSINLQNLLFNNFKWWSPYCNKPDGPSVFASGFPLPHTAPSIVVSIEYEVVLLAYLIDVITVAIIIFLAAKFLSKKIGTVLKNKKFCKVVLLIPLLLMSMFFTGFQSITSHFVSPSSLASVDYYGDSYFDFRPYIMIDKAKNTSCHR